MIDMKLKQENRSMRHQQKSLLIMLIFVMILIVFGATARPYIPKDKQQIVASWDLGAADKETNLPLSQRLSKVAWHIQQGQYAGQSNKHYGRAKALLRPVFAKQTSTALNQHSLRVQSQAWYLRARIVQYQHEFDLALEYLENSIALDTNNSAAYLLKANVLLTQGNFTPSLKSCSALLGKADLRLTTACVLEVKANQGELSSSYTSLSALLARQRPQNQAQNEQDWLLQLVAEMALKLDLYQEAETWLNQALTESQDLATKPLSFIVLWADVQLRLHQNQRVLRELSAVVEHAGFKDDALLTRLSLAEQSTPNNHWRNLLHERIDLRLARHDTFHSADLARFFLDIAPDPERALYWARINWQHAKLDDDKQLLERAQIMQNTAQSRPPSDPS
jgi:tetratricopeptide (TPR) repeat protein